MKNKKRIVITGIGPISSIGIGKDSFWQGILQKKINLKLEKRFIDKEIWGEFYLHKIDKFNIAEFGIDKDKLDDIRGWKEGEDIIDLNYLIAAIKLALDDSKLDYHSADNGIGLILAHENIGLMPFVFKVSNIIYEAFINNKQTDITKKDFFNKCHYNFLKSSYDVQTFANLFHVARVFNIHNYSLFLNNACASGLYALEAASQIIKMGQAKAVVVAASDCSDMYKYFWFRDLRIYSPDGIMRPFSKDSNGIVFGDGGVGVVVEDLVSAKLREAPIYAEYLGGGFDLEGWKITVPQIGSNSYQNAIQSALKHSNVTKENIDFLCPHGVSSQPIDYYEAKAITDCFGLNPKKPFITAFKPYIGHNLGGSALLETVAVLLSLKNNIIPPTLNCGKLDSKFNISLVTKKIEVKLNTAMKICCAFAGYNAASIFKKLIQ